MPVGCYPNNHCGRWFFQSRCHCGWHGKRRYILKSLILHDYLAHDPGWVERMIDAERGRFCPACGTGDVTWCIAHNVPCPHPDNPVH